MSVQFRSGYATNCGITTHTDVQRALRPELRDPSVRKMRMMHASHTPHGAIAIAAPAPTFLSLLLGVGFIAVAVDVAKGVYNKMIGKKG